MVLSSLCLLLWIACRWIPTEIAAFSFPPPTTTSLLLQKIPSRTRRKRISFPQPIFQIPPQEEKTRLWTTSESGLSQNVVELDRNVNYNNETLLLVSSEQQIDGRNAEHERQYTEIFMVNDAASSFRGNDTIVSSVNGEGHVADATEFSMHKDDAQTDGRGQWRKRLRRAIPGYKIESMEEYDYYNNEQASLDQSPDNNGVEQQRKKQTNKKNKFLSNLDLSILALTIPSMINLAVVPLVNNVDTFWVGRMGNALALAGQAAANQAFHTLFFIVAFLPTITAPLVARAVGSGNPDEAKRRVSESLFLCTALGAIGTVLLVGFPSLSLGLVLDSGAPAMEYATPYLRFRGLGVIPALLSATGFAAFRGLLDTMTPLRVSLGANLLNLVLDPLFIFATPMGFLGAALATILSEVASGATYLKLLLQKKLSTVKLWLSPPPLRSILPILQGGLSMLGRQAVLNVGFLFAARKAQSLDPSGVTGAAYGIVMQVHSLGVVVHLAVQSTAATLVPAAMAKSGPEEARHVGDRIFAWGVLTGLALGAVQTLALPFLVPLYSATPDVQTAIRGPAALSALLHIINGPVFPGEGVMLGLGSFRGLMLVTACGIASMMAGLRMFGQNQLNGIMWSFALFSTVQAIGVVTHYLKIGPLAIKKQKQKQVEQQHQMASPAIAN